MNLSNRNLACDADGNDSPKKISLSDWDRRYAELRAQGLQEQCYGGPIGRFAAQGDLRLRKLCMDNSAAAIRLWNFFLSEEDRLRDCQAQGKKLVGTMKDLGTVPVMVYSLPNLAAFYPDGAWWLPCMKENHSGLLEIADSLGIDDSFCPVRAMLGAFVNQKHFPLPGLLTCSVGATCDDFSAIARRLESLGFPIQWWEMPHRRRPDAGEPAVDLPGRFRAPKSQVAFVKAELERIRRVLEDYAGQELTDERLAGGIARANRVRGILAELRSLAYRADPCPLPALEMLLCEMLAIHFCSDDNETVAVLSELRDETLRRVRAGLGVLSKDAVRVFWVNPVADLQVMNLLEEVGGRIAGTDYLFCHALDPIPTELPPMEALARMALADPMVGSAVDRAARIIADIRRFGAEALVLSRIPGASHCAMEAMVIGDIVHRELDIPLVDIEIPSITDSMQPTLRTRLEALVETARARRTSCAEKV